MAKQKLERNKLFLEDWQKGFSNEALGKKYEMSEGGVKALKQRLRVRNPNLYAEKRPGSTKIERPDKIISPQVDKSTSLLVHKRATYYLSPETIKTIKQIALNKNIDSSELVRNILSEWISQQVDK